MSSERFQAQDRGSFLGDMIYDRVVPADHFPRKLEELVPWERFTRKLVKFLSREGTPGTPTVRTGGVAEDAPGGVPAQLVRAVDGGGGQRQPVDQVVSGVGGR